MKHVIILGGGFAGVRAALILKSRSSDVHITVIDKNAFHTFTPSLYEVATSEEPQGNVAIPYKDIFNESIELKQGIVKKVDPKDKKIVLNNNSELQYDYLIFALGSESADFGIPGIREYGIPLKTLDDAMQIKNVLKNAKKVVVGGGGFSGTEIACELATHKSHLDITLIQGSPVVLKELGGGISGLAKKRLEEGHVRLVLGERIKRVTKEAVELENGRKFTYDVFLWTGGVRPSSLLGKFEVNEFLQVNNFANIFAAGDVISPGVARRAIKMGKVAAENVLSRITGKKLLPYNYHNIGYLVPLGSHFATFAMGKFHISGIFAYIVQQLILFNYLREILPFFKAIKRFVRFEKDLEV